MRVLQYEQEYHVRKRLVICANQLAGVVLLKNLKYFKVMLNILRDEKEASIVGKKIP